MSFDTSNPIIKRAGSASVIYDLSKPSQTTITLPTGSTWTSGLHWHETHDEYLHVLQGSIRVRLGQTASIRRAGQEAKVPKHVRHEWSRADVDGGEEVIVVERTEPADEEKHLFFWNLNGTILLSSGEGPRFLKDWLIMLRLFMIFYELDNWPVLYEMSYVRRFLSETLAAYLEGSITHAVLASASKIGYMLSFKPIEERYTPAELYSTWKGGSRVKAA